MRIGLIGEAPFDTNCIKIILEENFSNIECFNLINHIRGSLLDNPKTKNILRVEYELTKPDLIIFIRDLDALLEDKDQLNKRKAYFTEFNRTVDKKGIYLLNIYEIEAIILSDINAFNSYYEEDFVFNGDPMGVEEPKEFLKDLTIKYNQIHNPSIFQLLDIETVRSNCEYFENFLTQFEQLISK